jgi:hypothetical protein
MSDQAREGLTVGELIAQLQAMPSGAEVMFDLGEEFVNVWQCRATDPEGAVVLSAKTALKPEPHEADLDCTLDEDGCCLVCGVYRNDEPCPYCGGWSFHIGDCPGLYEV